MLSKVKTILTVAPFSAPPSSREGRFSDAATEESFIAVQWYFECEAISRSKLIGTVFIAGTIFAALSIKSISINGIAFELSDFDFALNASIFLEEVG